MAIIIFLAGEDYEQPFPYYFNVRLHTLGSSTTCYNITLIADNIVEENKVFTLSLSVTEPALGFPLESDSDNAFVTIVNDDSKSTNISNRNDNHYYYSSY